MYIIFISEALGVDRNLFETITSIKVSSLVPGRGIALVCCSVRTFYDLENEHEKYTV